jgi:amino acid transporter/mannitol/fructose-specific phosphotransferase system IIA component (Ntr-type)
MLTRKRLKKELTLFDVYAVATGATLSSGFFLLPGLAAAEVGSAIVLAYMVAAIPLIPAMLCIVELATAMPRAGGVYYFLDRTLGPMAGTVGGIGTWLALVLKVSFALVGMGAYLKLFFPDAEIQPIAIGLAILLGLLNAFGAKKTGALQVFLVIGLLAILAVFIGGGLPEVNLANFRSMFDVETSSLLATAGMVYISYVGVTNVASLSEEVKDPERNLPLGVFLALATAIVVYALGTATLVGLVPSDELAGDLTPVATAAHVRFGDIGALFLSIAALLAFTSVANAGTLSASRYPLAMSRDHLAPRFFQRIGKLGTPLYAIGFSVGTIVAIIILLDPTKIAKLASSFQLFMFALICLAVIVMREAKLASYDPGYRSPFYPWLQIFGIVSAGVLIFEMGIWSLSFTLGLALVGVLWFLFYGRKRVRRTGAIFHVFERLGRSRYEGLDHELRGILREKGLREEDPFEEIVARSLVIDLEDPVEFEAVVEDVSQWVANHTEHSAEEIRDQLLERTHIGATPVTHGVGLPHLWIQELQHPEMVLVRCREPGVHIRYMHPLTDQETEEDLKAIFFLFSPDDDPSMHLRILAQIAEHVDSDSFASEWETARNDQELKEVLLHDERFVSLAIGKDSKTSDLVGHPLRDIDLPDGVLIAMVRRGNHVYVPDGATVLEAGDSLTMIGDAAGLKELHARYDPS